MACCNRRREGLASDPTARAPAPRAAPPASNRAAIRYLGGEAITVRGPVTGLAYAFSPRQAQRGIDRRDLAPLLRSRLFARA
jgi:hypothetical protein